MTSGDGDQPIIAIFQPDKVAVEECSAPKIRRYRPIIRSAFVDGQASADLLTPSCSADFNGDGSVSASDLLALLIAWGQNLAMHIAVVIGLLGFVGTVRGLMKLPVLLTSGQLDRPAAVVIQAAMAMVCFVFVLLCVRSFIKARRAGAAQQDS